MDNRFKHETTQRKLSLICFSQRHSRGQAAFACLIPLIYSTCTSASILEQAKPKDTVAQVEFQEDLSADMQASGRQLALYEATKDSLEKDLRIKDDELRMVEQSLAITEAKRRQNVELLKISLEKESRLKNVLDLIKTSTYEKVRDDIRQYESKISEAEGKLEELAAQRQQARRDVERLLGKIERLSREIPGN